MKYYRIKVNVIDKVNSYDVKLSVKPGTLTVDALDSEVVGHAIDVGKLDPDHMEWVESVKEITEAEFASEK